MDTSKALSLLQIPDDCAAFEGQIRQKKTSFIVIEELNDFTSGKRVITTSWKVASKTESFGAYPYNLISNYIHHFNYDVIQGEQFTLHKDAVMTDSGRWFGESKAIITPTSFKVCSDIGLNTTPTGQPTDYNNPPVRAGIVYRVQISKTKGANGAIKTYVGKQSYVPYTVNQLTALTGLTRTQIAELACTEFIITPVNNDTHITSIAMDVEKNDNVYTGVFHINGVPANSFQGKITSFGAIAPSYAFRWILRNNTPDKATIYGQSAMAQYSASDDNSIFIQAGTEDKIDVATKVLTYDEGTEEVATLIAMAEFLPAQGKNENAGLLINLESGLSEVW
jgi:hypothetical protein